MPNYQNGKIYCIRSFKTDNVYIGSTTQKLCERIGKHRTGYKMWKKGKCCFMNAYQILEHGDEYIELVEEYPCKNKMELCKREYEVMRNTENCISKILKSTGKIEDYSQGKIYIIKSSKTDDVYIGSTVQTLRERFTKHKSGYKRWLEKKSKYMSSFEIIKHDDAYIELIENYPCETIEELRIREGDIMKEYENCVNKLVAGRTHKQFLEEQKEHIKEQRKEYRDQHKEHIKEYNKEYRQQNKEHINEREKQYRQQNKEHINERTKQYRQQNKEHIKEREKQYRERPYVKEKKKERDKQYRDQHKEQRKEYDKEYREKNKDKIKENRKIKILCECGTEHTKIHLKRHGRSLKHQNYINNL